MLKTVPEVTKRLLGAYDKRWASEASGCPDEDWPLRVALGSPTAKDLMQDFAATCERCDELEALAERLRLGIDAELRRVGVSNQRIPTHIVVGDIDALAHAVGKVNDLAQARRRAARLWEDFGSGGRHTAEWVAGILTTCRRSVPDDVDFDLACRAATWFAAHDSENMTARQVPLEGFHAKWLDREGRRAVVAAMAGLERLDLLERPAIVRYAYLDPDHLASGGRRHDSHVVDDCDKPAYAPQTVIVVENRDTALWFPQLTGGIAVMGDGAAGVATVSEIPWVQTAERVLYWGDMDAAGLEILGAYRASGLAAQSILMNMDAYERYERFGTMVDKNGRPLGPKQPVDSPHLTLDELELYLHLVDPVWTRPRRIEQERIPLAAALKAIETIG